MKITSVDDKSGQLGVLIEELSNIYKEMDDEICAEIDKIKQKYQERIDEVNATLDSTRNLLS